MPRNLKKEIYGKLVRAVALIAPAPAPPTQIGPDIPPDMVRRITQVTLTFNVAGPQNVVFAQGHLAAPLARIMHTFNADPALGVPSVFGAREPTVPMFVCRPITTTVPIQQNQIYAVGLIAARPVTVIIEYWDQRG